MDWITRQNLFAINALCAFSRKFCSASLIHLAKTVDDRIASCEVRFSSNRLKQSSAHDFKTLVTRSWTPGLADSGKNVLQNLEHVLPVHSSDLNIRGRYRCHHQTIINSACRFGYRLGKCALRLKSTSRKIFFFDKLPRISNPLVY